MFPPQWVRDEQSRRESEAAAAFDWLVEKSPVFAAITKREDYIAAYLQDKYDPLIWTTSNMTRRESAISDAILHLRRDGADMHDTLSDLIDKAESGDLKEPGPISYASIQGLKTVYPDGRVEWVYRT